MDSLIAFFFKLMQLVLLVNNTDIDHLLEIKHTGLY